MQFTKFIHRFSPFFREKGYIFPTFNCFSCKLIPVLSFPSALYMFYNFTDTKKHWIKFFIPFQFNCSTIKTLKLLQHCIPQQITVEKNPQGLLMKSYVIFCVFPFNFPSFHFRQRKFSVFANRTKNQNLHVNIWRAIQKLKYQQNYLFVWNFSSVFVLLFLGY